MTQHTDRAIADLIDSLRNITPEMFEYMVRRTVSEGVVGFICIIFAIVLFVLVGSGLAKADKKSRKSGSMDPGIAALYLVYAGLALVITPPLFVLGYSSLLNLLAPEGTALLNAIKSCR